MRTRRLLLWSSGALLAALIGVYAASQTAFVRRQVLTWAEEGLTHALGRQVKIADVRLQPWVGRLDLYGIRVTRGLEPPQGPLLLVEALRARWSWTALFRGRLLLRQIALTHPVLSLLPPAPGTPALTMQDVLPALLQPQPLTVGGWPVIIRQAVVQTGGLRWTDAGGQQGTLADLYGSLDWKPAPDGVPSVSAALHATRLIASLGGARRQVDQIGLRLSGTAAGMTVSAAEFSLDGIQVTATGRIRNPRGPARLDLQVGIRAPLPALLHLAGLQRKAEGLATVAGTLRGPWEQLAFQGEASLQLGAGAAEPFRFTLAWADGRLELATAPGAGAPASSVQGRLTWEAATRIFRAHLAIADADLASLRGLPVAALALAGISPPQDLRGRLNAEIDVTGEGLDLAALRGRGRLRVDDLGLAGEGPAGRLEARVVADESGLDLTPFTLTLPGGEVRGRGRLEFSTGRMRVPFAADLRDVTGIAHSFGLPPLGGRVTFRGELAGTRSAPQLRGALTWREAHLVTRTFDLIQGDIALAGRTVKTARLSLRLGRTAISLRGSATAMGATPLRQLDLKRDVRFDLQGEANPGRTADLITFLPEELEVHGTFRASGRLSGTLADPRGEVRLTLGNVQTWEESWREGAALIQLGPQGIGITRILLQRGSEEVTGEIGIGKDGVLQGRLSSTPMDLARVGSLSGSQLTGRAVFQLRLEGTLKDTRTLGQVAAQTLAYRGIPLGPTAVTYTFEQKALDATLAFREGGYRLHLVLSPPPDRTVQAELTLVRADLDLVSRIADVPLLRRWQAQGSGTIVLRGPADRLEGSAGEASFTALRFQVGGQSWESQGPVQVVWKGSAVTIQHLSLQAGQHKFEILGKLFGGQATDLRVAGHLPFAALDGMLAAVHPTAGLAIADVRATGPLDAPSLQGTLEIAECGLSVTGLSAPFEDVRAALELRGDRILIRQWQARLAQGTFRGAGEIQRRESQWEVHLTFQEDGGRAAQLLAGLYQGKDGLTGALSLGGTLSSHGETQADFWSHLDGKLKLVMRDGRIGSNTILARIFSLLNVSQLLHLQVPDLFGKGMAYQQLTADMTITDGVLKTENLILDSQSMKVNAVGQANLADNTVDLTVAIKPLQTVDTLVTHIPIAGWLLGGKEKSLLVAYYHVTGPLHDPRVEPIPLKSVGRNIFGIFQNLLDIPEALIGTFKDLESQPPKADEGKGR